jgi:ribosome biogenesis protein ENP2
MTPDEQFVVVTGTYPPMVKVFEVRELSLKFERHMDSEVVQFEVRFF